MAANLQSRPDSPQLDSDVTPEEVAAELAALVAAWKEYQNSPRNEKPAQGLKFARLCRRIKGKFKGKAPGFLAVLKQFQTILKQSGIRGCSTGTVNWWMLTEDQREQRRKANRERYVEDHPRPTGQEMTVAAQSVAIGWKEYRNSPPSEKPSRGLKFGQVCRKVKKKFKAQGRKGASFLAVLKLSRISCSAPTVYWWIWKYEISIGVKKDDRNRERLREAVRKHYAKQKARLKQAEAARDAAQAKAEAANTKFAEANEKLERLLAESRNSVLPFPQPPLKKGRQREPETDDKIDLAGRLQAEGQLAGKSVSQRSMSLVLFPHQQHTPELAYANTRRLFSDHRDEIEAAKNRHLAAKEHPLTDVS